MITLAEIVDDYLSQYELPNSKSRRIERIAVRGFRLFWRDSTALVSTVTIPVQANNTAVMPADLQSILQIGVLNQRGEFASLTLDPLLSLGESTNPDRADQQVTDTLIPNTSLIFSFQDNFIPIPEPQWLLLGVGSTGTVGFYRPDWASRTFVFNFKFRPTQVILEYRGLPQTNNGEYYVDDDFAEAMIAFIAWQDALGSPKSNRSERRDLEDVFNMQYDNAIKAKHPFNPADLYNQQGRDSRLAPKAS